MVIKPHLFLQVATIIIFGLNTWNSKDAIPASKDGIGLFHTAILFPTRKDLAIIYTRLRKAAYPHCSLLVFFTNKLLKPSLERKLLPFDLLLQDNQRNKGEWQQNSIGMEALNKNLEELL